MLVFIGKLSPSALRWVPICQGFSHFSVFFASFCIGQLATSSMRVNLLYFFCTLWDLRFFALCFGPMNSELGTLIWSYRQFLFNWPAFVNMFWPLSPFAAVVTFVQCSKKQNLMKIILTLSYWYSLESSCWVLSDEYPFAMVLVIFQFFVIISCWPNKKPAAKGL